MKNEFGIYDKSYDLILGEISKYPAIEKAVIFGSRAMGDYKKGSDIDIAVFGKKIDRDMILTLHSNLNEILPVPYYVDVVHFETLNSEPLKKHILEKGKLIYNADSA